MPPADDRPAPLEPDLDTDEGLEAFVLGIQRPIPERLRYPETDEEFDRMIAEAQSGGYVSGDRVLAWIRSWGTENELPRPTCED